jgi:hypothetical protein
MNANKHILSNEELGALFDTYVSLHGIPSNPSKADCLRKGNSRLAQSDPLYNFMFPDFLEGVQEFTLDSFRKNFLMHREKSSWEDLEVQAIQGAIPDDQVHIHDALYAGPEQFMELLVSIPKTRRTKRVPMLESSEMEASPSFAGTPCILGEILTPAYVLISWRVGQGQ